MRRSPRVEQAEALLLHMHAHVHVVTASITLCRKYRVAASITYGCSLYHIGLQVATSRVGGSAPLCLWYAGATPTCLAPRTHLVRGRVWAWAWAWAWLGLGLGLGVRGRVRLLESLGRVRVSLTLTNLTLTRAHPRL